MCDYYGLNDVDVESVQITLSVDYHEASENQLCLKQIQNLVLHVEIYASSKNIVKSICDVVDKIADIIRSLFKMLSKVLLN